MSWQKILPLSTWKLLTISLGCAGSVSAIPVVFEKPHSPPKQFHTATYRFGWDINMSPYAGGEDLLFTHRGIERIEGWAISKSPVCFSRSIQAKLWRLSELTTFWLPLNYLAIVVQHEIFGHGYRIRDINHGRVKVSGYEIGVPVPYGTGGGLTAYKINDQFTTFDATSVAMAGVESTAILAQLIKLKWLEAHRVDPRQTAMYLFGQYDLPLYVGDLKVRNDKDLDGHDIHSYITTLNETYTNSKLTVHDLYTGTIVNFADAFTYYSIYAWFRYVITGRETRIPMIPIMGYKYLPGLRMGLTPFGPEYFFENYLLKGRNPYYFYFKGGQHSKNNYFGLGFYAPKIWALAKHFSLGARFDAWRQPKYLQSPGQTPLLDLTSTDPNPTNPLYPYSLQHKMINGVYGSVLVSYRPNRRYGGDVELGWKTPGFLPGNALRTSPIARLFFSLRF